MIEPIIVAASDNVRNIIRSAVREGVIEALSEIHKSGKTESTEPEKYLSVSETAELLGMSISGVRKAARRGDLPVRRVGRKVLFRQSDITKALEGKRPRKQG